MKINDTRGKNKVSLFSELIAGEVYVSPRLNKYFFSTDDLYIVCLDTGELFAEEEFIKAEEFIPVKARLEIE